MKQVEYNESFKDNRSNWHEMDNETANIKLQGGCYSIEHKVESIYAVYQQHFMQQSNAYTIEMTLRYKDDNRDGGQVGIVWELFIGNDQHWNHAAFLISESHFYIGINDTKEQTWTPIKNWTESSAIKSGKGEQNTLRIVKFDNDIDMNYYYFINDQMVHSSGQIKVAGQKNGIILIGKIAVDVTGINLSYTSMY